ncbi:hypothetical protein Pla110_08230 [Polystyrenella longa]|uniref:MgtE intracellular N domain protein n=1 Tax=Polystyrenella longa TaxID=2528007 RepID=A0A518CIQ7_9PLAN|nr:hypothetical protein [Polystyrenella longa]QDU79118.1 hypothetical protein Pla110_08230 [Polystyrenella longa]
MLRTLGAIIGVMAVATLITEGVVVAFYWNQGTLTNDSLQDIKMIMQGIDPSENDPIIDEEDKESEAPSQKEISNLRALRVVGIHERENILSTIGENLRKEAQRIEEEKTSLEQLRDKFQKEMEEITQRNTSTEVERARGVLQSLKPDAMKVEHLMTLDLADCVILIKEMENKEIAKILTGFSDSNQVEVQERGKQVFQNIYQGEPLNSVAQKTMGASQL